MNNLRNCFAWFCVGIAAGVEQWHSANKQFPQIFIESLPNAKADMSIMGFTCRRR